MLALRILILAGGGLLVITLLGYALTRDKRWLNWGQIVGKVAVALLLLLLLGQLLERIAL